MKMKVRRLFRMLANEISGPGAAFRPEPSDVMLVSYPKSGNTWVRALVSNVIRPGASLQAMDRLVPDVYRCTGRDLRNAYRFPSGGRLIKSHECFRPTYKRVIYVARDPRDVCVSYYHYLKKVRRSALFSELELDAFVPLFLSGKADRYGTWAEHVRSWGCAEQAQVLRVSYEELLAAPADHLRRISAFLGLQPTEDALALAVAECSIDALRKKEESSNWSVVEKADSGGRFFRAGKANNWTGVDQGVLQPLYRQWGEDMKTLGYLY